jgi:hypothetical protein
VEPKGGYKEVAANFSELLDANRLRPLWKSGKGAPAALGEPAPRKPLPSELLNEADANREPAQASDEADEISDAPPEPPPRETPTQILDKLERLLFIILGPQALLLQVYLQPLRRGLSRLEGHPHPPHPLQYALKTGNLPLLIYQLEDSFRGILRVQQQLGQRLGR